jgi:cobalt-zinc-cadmium efflux system protein
MGKTHAHPPVSNKKLFWTILFNIGITAAEVVGGLITGYLALLADAMHNLSDVAALVLAWLGIKGSQKPATKTSTYGYKRIEVMTAFISAVSLVVIAVFIVMEAYERLLNPTPITDPPIFLSVAIIGLLGNVFSIYFLHSEKGKSLNMKTAFLHMAYDAISSVGVIIGAIVIILTGWFIIDAILSTAIAVMILGSSYLVIKEALMIFMEAVPDRIDFDAVAKAILDVPKVQDVHDLHIWSLSSHEVALSCHVGIDEKDFHDGQDIIAAINTMLNERFNIGHGTIQIEKCACTRPDLLCSDRNHEHHRK